MDTSRLPAEERTSVGINAPLPASGTRHPHWHSRTPSSGTAEAAAAIAMLGSPPSRDLEPGGRCDGEARPNRVGGGPASIGRGGSRWFGAGDRSHRALGADSGRDHDGRVQIAPPPPTPDPRLPRSPQHQGSQQNDRRSQPRSPFPQPRTAVTPPRSDLVGSDPATSGTALRPSVSGVPDPVHLSPRSRGLAEKATSTAGGQEAGGRGAVAFDNGRGDPGRCRDGAGESAAGAGAGAGGDARAATEWGGRAQQRWEVVSWPALPLAVGRRALLFPLPLTPREYHSRLHLRTGLP